MKTEKEKRMAVMDRLFRSPGHTMKEIKDAIASEGLGARSESISDRTFDNYRKEIEGQTGVKVICPKAEDGAYRYRYKSNYVATLEGSGLTDKQFRALHIAEKALEVTLSIPESRVIREIIDHIKLEEGPKAYKNPKIEEVVSFSPCPVHEIDPEIWNPLYEAIENRRKIKVYYRKGWTDPDLTERIMLRPLRLANFQGVWYLLAVREDEPELLRQYHLSRMESVTVGQKSFSDPPFMESVDDRIRKMFGRFLGPEEVNQVKMTLHFTERVQGLISGHKFHANQRMENLPEGGIRLSFPVSPYGAGPEWRYYHVRCWILSFGKDCKVIEPPELRELIKKDLADAAAVY